MFCCVVVPICMTANSSVLEFQHQFTCTGTLPACSCLVLWWPCHSFPQLLSRSSSLHGAKWPPPIRGARTFQHLNMPCLTDLHSSILSQKPVAKLTQVHLLLISKHEVLANARPAHPSRPRRQWQAHHHDPCNNHEGRGGPQSESDTCQNTKPECIQVACRNIRQQTNQSASDLIQL